MRAMIVLAAAALAASATATPNAVFDKPVKTASVPLPRDPDNPQAKPKRSCSYYSGFVVKETDLGEKGAAELSITPVKGAPPACIAKIKGEFVVNPDDWAGYFLGAKAAFVFFTADDGRNNGMPFAVYGSENGKKLFEDSLQLDGTFQSVGLVKGELVARYRRVFTAPCSLHADTAACWKTIVSLTSLPVAARPDCSKAYKAEMARTPKFAADIVKSKSVISYNAELRYAQGKLRIMPLPGAAKCWIED